MLYEVSFLIEFCFPHANTRTICTNYLKIESGQRIPVSGSDDAIFQMSHSIHACCYPLRISLHVFHPLLINSFVRSFIRLFILSIVHPCCIINPQVTKSNNHFFYLQSLLLFQDQEIERRGTLEFSLHYYQLR